MYCVYNGHNLDDGTNYQTLSIDVSTPDIKINKYELARADGVIVTGKQYGQRTITIKGKIYATNLKEADDRLDTFNSFFNEDEQDLLVEVSDTKRVYTASLEGISITKTGYYYEWELKFTTNSFGKTESDTDLTFGTYTSSPTTYNNTIGGSYKANPIIDFTVNYIEPSWTSKYLQITNPYNSRIIRITRNWSIFDRVIINGDSKTVNIYPTTVTEIDDCDSDTSWTSSHTLSEETTLMKEGTGALKNVMATAHDHVDWIRLDYTSVDLSSTMGTLLFWLFIPTPTAGAVSSIEFVAGSDATLANNYATWGRNTQYDGSAIATGAWNLFGIDLSTTPTSTGSPVRTAIISIKVSILGTASTMRLVGAMLDYMTLHKASVTAEALDYEGTFLDLDIGNSTLVVTDEFTNRNITFSGYYYKRYL